MSPIAVNTTTSIGGIDGASETINATNENILINSLGIIYLPLNKY